MKQKIVMKVSINEPKKRSKALKLVAGVQGVLSAALEGDDKDQIVVIGEEVDSVCVTKLLRKHIGHTELVSVSNPDEKAKKDDKVQPIIWQTGQPCPYYMFEVDQQSGCEPCSIM